MVRNLTTAELIELQSYMQLWDAQTPVDGTHLTRTAQTYENWTSHNLSHLRLSMSSMPPPFTTDHLSTIRTLFQYSVRFEGEGENEHENRNYVSARALEMCRSAIMDRILNPNSLSRPIARNEQIQIETAASVLAGSLGIEAYEENAEPFPANVLRLLEYPESRERILQRGNTAQEVQNMAARTMTYYLQNHERGAHYDTVGNADERGMHQQERIVLEWSIDAIASYNGVRRVDGNALIGSVDGVFTEYPVSDVDTQAETIAFRRHDLNRGDLRAMDLEERIASLEPTRDALLPAVNMLFQNSEANELLGRHGAGLFLHQLPIAIEDEPKITSGYGHRERPDTDGSSLTGGGSSFHLGADFASTLTDRPINIRPTRDGAIAAIMFNPSYGLTVALKHRNQYGQIVEHTTYSHLASLDPDIARELAYLNPAPFISRDDPFIRRHPEFANMTLDQLADPAYVSRLSAVMHQDVLEEARTGRTAEPLMLFGANEIPPTIIVRAGGEDSLGIMGSSGEADGAHLHYMRILNRNQEGLDEERLRQGRINVIDEANIVVPMFTWPAQSVSAEAPSVPNVLSGQNIRGA